MVPNSPKYAYYLDAHHNVNGDVVQINQYTYEYRYRGMTIRPVWKP